MWCFVLMSSLSDFFIRGWFWCGRACSQARVPLSFALSWHSWFLIGFIGTRCSGCMTGRLPWIPMSTSLVANCSKHAFRVWCWIRCVGLWWVVAALCWVSTILFYAKPYPAALSTRALKTIPIVGGVLFFGGAVRPLHWGGLDSLVAVGVAGDSLTGVTVCWYHCRLGKPAMATKFSLNSTNEVS